uniref:Genome polyprotein n=1 Tax=Picornavirales sp. TaxID=1955153 RepID=A0A6M3YNR5_9VIRU|nr:MAG: hypothetical protein 1 [Picornavirales sp.]
MSTDSFVTAPGEPMENPLSSISDSLKALAASQGVEIDSLLSSLTTAFSRTKKTDTGTKKNEPSTSDSGIDPDKKKKEPDIFEECHMPVPHPHVEENDERDIYAYSIVVPCSIRNIWPILIEANQTSKDETARILRNGFIKRAGSGCGCTLIHRVIHDMLHHKFVIPLSEFDLYRILTMRMPVCRIVTYDPAYASTPVIMRNVLNCTREISMIFQAQKGTPGIDSYQKLTRIIATLPLNMQAVMQNAINCRFGPITALAASINQENINFWMGQIKISNTTFYLDNMFRNPSLAGKCHAIFNLLELHDMVWRSMDMAKIHTFVMMIYRFISFMMEQTKAAYHYAKGGFEWVKAKFQKGNNETTMFPGVDPSLPETEEDFQTGVSTQPGTLIKVAPILERWLDKAKDGVKKMAVVKYKPKSFEKAESTSSVLAKEIIDHVVTEVTEGTILEDLHKDVNVVEKMKLLTNWMYDELNAASPLSVPSEAYCDSLPNGADFMNFTTQASDFDELWATVVNRRDNVEERLPKDQEQSQSGTGESASLQKDSSQGTPSPTPTIVAKKEPPSPPGSINVNLESVPDNIKKQLLATDAIIRGTETSTIGLRFLEWLKRAFTDVYKFFTEHPFVVAVMGLIYTILSFCGFTIGEFTSGNKKPFFSKVSSAMKDIYYANRGKEALLSGISNFTQVAAAVLELDEPDDVKSFKENLIAIHDKSYEMAIKAASNPGQFVNNGEGYNEFKTTILRIKKQYEDLVRLNPRVNINHLAPIWQRVAKHTDIINQVWTKYVSTGGVRQEPVCIWLHGETNIGKSRYAEFLINEINRLNGTQWKTFTISKGPDYWNGFKQENIIKIDDFAAYVGPEGCLDALAVMNLCSCSAYNPNMAAIEDKNIAATPKIFIICANFPTVPVNSGVMDMIAFERRRDIFAHVTWPDHQENCGVTTDCRHFKGDESVKADNFDHLVVTLQNPIVSVAQSDPRMKNPARGARLDGIRFVPGDTKDIAKARPADMVNLINALMKQKEKVFNDTIQMKQRSMGVTNQPTVEIENWDNRPNVILSGPAGVGKSTMFSTLAKELASPSDIHNKTRTVRHIKAPSEFESFADEEFCCTDDVVIFDDISSHATSASFAKWVSEFKSRYDRGRATNLWIIGSNPQVTAAALQSAVPGSDFEEVFYRRAEVFDITYKRTKLIFRFYTHADMKSCLEKKKNPDHIISIRKRGTDQYYTIDSMRATLRGYYPTMEEMKIITRLPIIHEYEPDCSMVLHCTSDEFVARYMNQKGSLQDTIGLLTGDEVEFYVKEGVHISKMEIGTKIMQSYRNCRQAAGCQFTRMYDFVLEAWTHDYFTAFQGKSYLMCFSDVSFYIRTNSNGIEAGVFEPIDLMKFRIAQQASYIKESITALEVADVVMGNLPPWFAVGIGTIELAVKFGATAFATAYGVSSNSTLFRAIRAERVIHAATDSYIDIASEAMGSKFEASVDQTYPLKPNHGGTILHTVEHHEQKPIEPFRSQRTGDSPVVPEVSSSDTPGTKATNFRANIPKPKRNCRIEIPSAQCARVDLEEVHDEEEVAEEVYQEVGVQQMASDPSVPQTILAMVKNCVAMCTPEGTFICHGLMLGQHTGTTVLHILEVYKEKDLRIITYEGKLHSINITKQFMTDDRMDFEIADKRNCPAFRNILNHIVKKGFCIERPVPCILFNVSLKWYGSNPAIMLRTYELHTTLTYETLNSKIVYNGMLYKGRATGYKMPEVSTFDGDCGSVLVVCDPNLNAKVVGMHTAAGKYEAYARHIFRDDYIDVFGASAQSIDVTIKPGPYGRFGMMDEFIIPKESIDRSGHKIEAIAMMRQFTPSTTKYWKSPIPLGEEMFEPSVLSKHDTRASGDVYDVMAQETFKWMQPRVDIPQEDLLLIEECCRDIGDYIGRLFLKKGTPIRILSKTEALNKMRGAEHSKPISIGTSPGYPWNALSQNGKRNFIDVMEDGSRRFAKNKHAQLLINAVDRRIDDARNNRFQMAAWKVCLKDELRKKSKVRENTSTRTIACCPLDLTIALRQYMHSVHAGIAGSWQDLPPKIGIDASSLDWHLMFTKMLGVSSSGFDFDFKGWDFKCPPQLVERLWIIYDAILRLCCKDYDEEVARIMRNLYLHCTKFFVLLMNRIYRVTGGVASGAPGTANDNSLIGWLNMYFAWKKIMLEAFPPWASLFYFMLFVVLCIYGDDVVVAVSPEVQEFFNAVTVAKILTDLGWEVTSADKTSVMIPIKPLIECEFMSRGFEKMMKYWVGPLRWPQVLKCTHYLRCRKSHNFWEEQGVVNFEVGAVEDMALGVLKEAFLHGREKYEQVREHFYQGFQKLGLYTYLPTYSAAWEQFFSMSITHQIYNPTNLINLHTAQFVLPELVYPSEDQWDKFSNRTSVSLGVDYQYMGSIKKAVPLFGPWKDLLKLVNDIYKPQWEYNSILVNRYEVGGEIPLHKDNEPGLIRKCGVTCLTIEGNGTMIFVRDKGVGHAEDKPEFMRVSLSPGDVYHIGGIFLSQYKHGRFGHTEKTVSLSFRRMKVPHA